MILSPRFEEALVFANRLHGGQVRKGSGAPYVSHLLTVTALVLEHGGGEDEAIAALLHDAIEDQGGAAAREEIRRRFSERIVALVDGCTDANTVPKPPWRQRKEAFIVSMAEASPEVRLIVAADKLHNARSVLADYQRLGEDLWPRFTGGREGTLWYYRAVTDALLAAGPTPIVEDLAWTVGELEAAAGATTTTISGGEPD